MQPIARLLLDIPPESPGPGEALRRHPLFLLLALGALLLLAVLLIRRFRKKH